MHRNPSAGLVEMLRAAGLKITPQRLAVAQCLEGDDTHPTAQELYERLRPRFPSMSVATVYNTLSALGAIDHCRQLEMGGPSRFDPNVKPHDHAVCQHCGAIRDVDIAGKSRADAGCSLPGFRVARVERIYRGICAKCADAAE
jgi:Fur family peroxide stress response transcriptional regulator